MCFNLYNKFNDKYDTKIDINIIIQNEDEIAAIVNKTCNCILEFFFDIYENEDETYFDFKKNWILIIMKFLN